MQEDDWDVIPGSIREKVTFNGQFPPIFPLFPSKSPKKHQNLIEIPTKTVILATDDESIKAQMAEDQWDLYTPTGDIEDEVWVRENRKGAGEKVLSCPGCFTQVAYQFEEHTKFEGQYRCKDVWGCEFGPELSTPDGSHFLQVLCSECRTDLGLWEFSTGKYHLFHILPGFG